jgi:hypothetical protein
MANKDFKVKNKLQVGGITASGPVVADASGNLDSTSSIATQFGGTGTTTSPTSGQILYSSAGTTYAPATLAGLPGTYAVGNTDSRPGSPSLGQIYSNTETGYIEVYTSAGWSQLGVIPLTPNTPVSTDVGTNVAYGSGAASISFTPASGGGLASTFTATSSPGSITGSSSSSPVSVTGLTLGTSYTFTVIATNGYGNATATSPSNSITTTSLPQLPTIGTATNVSSVAYGSNPSATLTFTSGATGGKTISNYKYSTDGTTYTAFSPEQTTSPLTISGLTSGTSYTFRLKAVSSNGDSLASASASNSITASTVPQAPNTPTATNVGTSRAYNNGSASVAFTAQNTGGSAITSYTVTSSPGSYTATGASSPLVVTGLQSNTSYTFTTTATNVSGTSSASSASSSITATTVPQAPTIGTPTVTNATTVSIPFTAAATGGSAITSYTVVSSPSIALSTSGTSSPLTVTGTFADNTAYTFTIAAVNANGTSLASSSSSSVTPKLAYALAQTFNASGSYTIPSGKTKIAAWVVGAGGGGAGGRRPSQGGSGGHGGAGGAVVGFKDYAVSAGSVYNITIGAGGGAGPGGTGNSAQNNANSGGTTNFATPNVTLVTANGGTYGKPTSDGPGQNTSPNSYYYNERGPGGSISNNITVSTQTTGTSLYGGPGYAWLGNYAVNGGAGGAGTGQSLTMTLDGLGTVNFAAGGGGGAGAGGTVGASQFASLSGGSGGAGAGGGSGGAGGNVSSGTPNSGAGGNAAGAGGGGNGGGGAGNATYYNGSTNTTSGGSGSNGGTGQVIIYVM